MDTCIIMIGDAGGSEVYRQDVPREKAETMVEANKRQNKIDYTGYVLWIAN